MMGLTRKTLFAKLNPLCYQALEEATALCQARRHGYVELVHWLDRILASQDNDLTWLLGRLGIDLPRVTENLARALDRLPNGTTAVTDFSGHIEETVAQGWLIADLALNAREIRSGHLLLAWLNAPELHRVLRAASPELAGIAPADILDVWPEFSKKDGAETPQAGASASGDKPVAPTAAVLDRFTTDLTQRARAGDLDPVTGRDREIRQLIEILLRRRQNNPLLTGEAGVGKTAIVEGFAQKIATGAVPPPLQGTTVRALDLALLQAGASMRGEFEKRLRDVIEAVETAPEPVILFIDEAHTLIGAGGQEGTGDAANLLKPALARGSLRTIAATTWGEYKRHIEKDAALARRFQVIGVEEPDEEEAIAILQRLVAPLEEHHGVDILCEAVDAAVRLSHRYLPSQQLPDKAVRLLDTACARVALSEYAPPEEVDALRTRVAALECKTALIARETGPEMPEGDAAAEALSAAKADLAALETRWSNDRAAVRAARNARGVASDLGGEAVVTPIPAPSDKTTEAFLAIDRVDMPTVAAVMQSWTGISTGRLLRDEGHVLLSLADRLGERVKGQGHAMEAIARRVRTSRAGLEEANRPVGVFLLCGPSGVGKTETALALADLLLGNEEDLITVNMSEFQEAHSVATLKGAPPGYVGYGQGGVLTEAVRRRPRSVILLDEVEKAHPDVHEIFFQVFDKGRMEDSEGRLVDFRNALILLTSNVGADTISTLCLQADAPSPDQLEDAIATDLRDVFPPALLGRMITLPYYPLDDALLRTILMSRLERIATRLWDVHSAEVKFDASVIDFITAKARGSDAGGRRIDAILTGTVLPELSARALSAQIEGRPLGTLNVDILDGVIRYSEASPDDLLAQQTMTGA
ncbi:type VI secretion system ATPase TssH [Thalassococcus sp. S3]|uniref:type VI secretion system ATPase TssH n=1 Tax=Thalassococcus sp. S3 TaxID=2017482 RepID=UPI00102457FA|nr:type VI secretion system ATPase TssH [Thalassococcus sp. S3]QBF33987.1 ClpV1 family T6SS ATPase [Thalassococcus sp. S3]